MSQRCSMIVGFLVPHCCEESALGACIQCGRRYCQEHLRLMPAGLVCTACAEGRTQPVVLDAPTGAALGALGPADIDAFSRAEASERGEDGAFSDLS